jgi:hypothetical protein
VEEEVWLVFDVEEVALCGMLGEVLVRVVSELVGDCVEEVMGGSVCVSLGALLRGYFFGIEAASLPSLMNRA